MIFISLLHSFKILTQREIINDVATRQPKRYAEKEQNKVTEQCELSWLSSEKVQSCCFLKFFLWHKETDGNRKSERNRMGNVAISYMIFLNLPKEWRRRMKKNERKCVYPFLTIVQVWARYGEKTVSAPLRPFWMPALMRRQFFHSSLLSKSSRGETSSLALQGRTAAADFAKSLPSVLTRRKRTTCMVSTYNSSKGKNTPRASNSSKMWKISENIFKGEKYWEEAYTGCSRGLQSSEKRGKFGN